MLLVPAGTLESSAGFSSGSEIQRHKSLQCPTELGLMESMVSLFLAQLWVVLAYSSCAALGSLYMHSEKGFQPTSSAGVDSLAVICCVSLSSVLQSLSDKVLWNVDLKKELLSLSFHDS